MGYKDIDRAIVHLEKVREDIRDEIKKRIEQRDKYSIQLTIALSTIIALAFTKPAYSNVLIVSPLVSIYFTVLIMYSYEIHRTAARYLRKIIEPELAFLCGTSVDIEWETYYKKNKVPGIRHGFFLLMMGIVSILSLAYLWSKNTYIKPSADINFKWWVLLVSTGIYSLTIISIYIWRYRERIVEIIIGSGIIIVLLWILTISCNIKVEKIALIIATIFNFILLLYIILLAIYKERIFHVWKKCRKRIMELKWIKKIVDVKSILNKRRESEK